jgi:peptidoglycan hydrolase-like protein with peptidoglycan-binding domain
MRVQKRLFRDSKARSGASSAGLCSHHRAWVAFFNRLGCSQKFARSIRKLCQDFTLQPIKFIGNSSPVFRLLLKWFERSEGTMMKAKVQQLSEKQAPSNSTYLSRQSGLLQYKCACGGTAGIDGRCAHCRKERLLRGSGTAMQAERETAPPIVHETLGRPGQPLDGATRGFMEPRFGHDFSQVRVHADAKAAESARAIDAVAYTVGQDVVFGAQQYTPTTVSGRQLLAHELAHVVQQRGQLEASGEVNLAPPDASHESEADRVAEDVVLGGVALATPRLRAGVHIQRQGFGELRVAEARMALEEALAFNAALSFDAQTIRIVQGVVGAPATGVWDNATISRINIFQNANGLRMDGKVTPDTLQRLIEKLIAASQFDDTIHVIVNAFHFPTANLAAIVFDASVTGADAVTSGVIGTGKPQTVSVGPSTFTASYAHMIRIIGHELQHVQQRSGATPIVNQHLREALAFAWEALSTDSPALPPAERVNHAQIAIQHWNLVPAADRTPHQAVRDRLDKLIAAKGVGNF